MTRTRSSAEKSSPCFRLEPGFPQIQQGPANSFIDPQGTKIMKKSVLITILPIFLLGFSIATDAWAQPLPPSEAGASDLWVDMDEVAITVENDRLVVPSRYRVVSLDTRRIDELLKQAPREQSENTRSHTVVSLPLPNGSFGLFAVVESPVMATGLAEKFPEIKTYVGQGLDDPTRTVRFDLTPAGFHAMIISSKGTVFIDPFQRGDIVHYIVYNRRDLALDALSLQYGAESCLVLGTTSSPDSEIARWDTGFETLSSGEQLRTYRLAVAATGEYTQGLGGTVGQGMAAIVTTMNRVNAIYERDLAVRMILVANNDLIIYTDPATDPYDETGFNILTENQVNLDSVIGNANYDIGHVFTLVPNGSAWISTVCESERKAQGKSGARFGPPGHPENDLLTAHEMGHQFGANHTFNGDACFQHNDPTAYEPGSGSTLMSYSGTLGFCGDQELQYNRDGYFHSASIDEIIANTTTGSASTCPVVTETGNSPPVPSVPAGGFTIPVSTPFTLPGAATDPEGDTLTYCWEEFDLGDHGPPNCASCDAPIFRSFEPSAIPSRTFPQLSDILSNTETLGEVLPDITRELNFRLTVRDNSAGGGGVDHQNISFFVTDTAGPFSVTAPDTGVGWVTLTTQNVSWNVAQTNTPPVSCENVNILLSTDGGVSFPVVLELNTPNDGSQDVLVPDMPTTSARIKVEAADNFFFDLSDQDFAINTRGVAVDVDIRPQSCPNPLRVKSKGVLPVAILGSDILDVANVDPTSVTLEGVAPLRWSMEDISTHRNSNFPEDCYDCTEDGPDGFVDLTFKFSIAELMAAIGYVQDRECLPLQVTGQLFDGTQITGEDNVVFLAK